MLFRANVFNIYKKKMKIKTKTLILQSKHELHMLR